MTISPSDTIAAIATPLGHGGVGIIRVSGPNAHDILQIFFKPFRKIKRFASHRLYHGWLVHQKEEIVDQEFIDEILAVYMSEGKSYTGEPSVEFHCHGSPTLLQYGLELILSSERARLAEPGEFTKRAFLNDRIDLTQAEAVMELISAESKESLFLAARQLNGGLAEKISEIKEILVPVKAHCEAIIDFAVQEIEDLDTSSTLETLHQALKAAEWLIQHHQGWKLFHSTHDIVILGKPNVGKSSLLNSLLGTSRAIVADLPGTTRDTVEEKIFWQGIPFRLIDTAGLCEPQNNVEQQGIERSRQKLKTADIVLWVLDGNESLPDEDLSFAQQLPHSKTLLVINKIDLPQKIDLSPLLSMRSFPLMKISCLKGEGIETLKEALVSLVSKGSDKGEGNIQVSVNARHFQILNQLRSVLKRVIQTLRIEPLALDLVVVDLQESLDLLGEILGETISDEVLETLFKKFCIGK